MNFFSLFKRKLIFKLKKKINIDQDGVERDSLDELFEYYGSDKSNYIKKRSNKGHGFSKYYSQYLKDFKYEEINILEVGSFAGASAAAFIKYLKNCSVFCFDVNISKFIYSSNKIHVYGLDINNQNKIKRIIKKIKGNFNINSFEMIIDDGSHYLSDILLSFNFFFKYVKKGGVYVIEDLKYPNYFQYNNDIEHIFVYQVLYKIQKKEFFSSSIIDKNDQIYFQQNIKKINFYKGNSKNSDICFIEKI